MGYSINNLKEALHKSLVFVDVIESNGYKSVDGSFQSFFFEKQITKTNDGAEENFSIHVNNQISGYVSAKLRYMKKLKESSNTLNIEQWLACDTEKIDDTIKACEQKCLLAGSNF